MTHRALRGATTFAFLLIASAAGAQVQIDHGGLWQVDVHASVKACLQGHCATSSAEDSEQFDLPSGAIVNVGILVGGCAAVVDPADLGQISSYVPAKRGRLKLKVRNRKLLKSLLKGCTGYQGFVLGPISGKLVPAPDGESFDTTVRVGFSLLAQGHRLGATLVVKVHGARIGNSDDSFVPEVVDAVRAALQRLELLPAP